MTDYVLIIKKTNEGTGDVPSHNQLKKNGSENFTLTELFWLNTKACDMKKISQNPWGAA